MLFLFAEDHPDGIAEVAPGQEFQSNGKKDAGADKKNQHDRSPDEVVYIGKKL